MTSCGGAGVASSASSEIIGQGLTDGLVRDHRHVSGVCFDTDAFDAGEKNLHPFKIGLGKFGGIDVAMKVLCFEALEADAILEFEGKLLGGEGVKENNLVTPLRHLFHHGLEGVEVEKAIGEEKHLSALLELAHEEGEGLDEGLIASSFNMIELVENVVEVLGRGAGGQNVSRTSGAKGEPDRITLSQDEAGRAGASGFGAAKLGDGFETESSWSR